MSNMKKFTIISAVCLSIAIPNITLAATPLDSYNRSAAAYNNYTAMYGSTPMSEAAADPELADIMQKYIYGDIAMQAKITKTEQELVRISVLTAGGNQKMLKKAVEGALKIGIKPLEIRETIYHLAPYVGFPKVFDALETTNAVFRDAGIPLPLPKQGTTNDENRFEKGLKFQVDTYGERINTMRNNTPDEQKHLMDDLAAFCFGDTYTRGTLDYKMREMITMAAIGTLGTGDPQYKSHVAGTIAAGASTEEVIGVITVMNPYIGFPRTLNCLRIANEVFYAK